MAPLNEVVEVDPAAPDPAVMRRAGELIRSGATVAFPTETVYGLGVAAFDPQAVRSVFAAKGRPANDPLIVHSPDVESLDQAVAEWPDRAIELAERFWPGPLTMVLARSSQVPDEVTAGLDTVAVRVPAHRVAQHLLRAAAVPVAAPSANRFGRVSPTSADHVLAELAGRFDLLLDGGPTPLGIESTVVDMSGDVPVVLRPGGITLEDLRLVLGEVRELERGVVADDAAATAPGRFLRHYAPSTPVVLVEGGADLVDELADLVAAGGVACEAIVLPGDPAEAARVLYATLRVADRGDADLLLAPVLDPGGLGRAVNDRLFRSALGRVVIDTEPGTVQRLVDLARS